MSFVERLNKVVEELKANSEILVAHYQVLPPNVEAIENVENALGYKLDSSITDFYKECGGIQLLWLNKDNEDYDDLDLSFTSNEPLDLWFIKGEEMRFYPDGSIFIPSIEDVFLTDWASNGLHSDVNDFDEKITHNFEDFKIQVLDWFSSHTDFAFLLNGTSNPPLVMGEDNQATYTDSHLIDFSLYLEFLIKSRGSIEMREDLFNKYNNEEIEGFVQLSDIEKIEFSNLDEE